MSATPSIQELDFEKPLLQIERQIQELEKRADLEGADIEGELADLRESHAAMLAKIYGKLNAWNTVKLARHPQRPQPLDYLKRIAKDFCELHGDRRFGDDKAIRTGLARIGSHKCLIVASHKGRDTRERIACNFGMGHPEGYRKAMLKMELAAKWRLPIVTLIDTPGAYPGVGAEERGQAEAIAGNLFRMSKLPTPILSVVVSEGGSGGALGIGVCDRMAMMQYAWFSVISPEACSAILWKSAESAERAASALCLTAPDNLRLGTIDAVIDEPLGGAHRHPDVAADRLEQWLVQNLRELKRYKPSNLVARRYERLRKMGVVEEAGV